VAGKTPLELLQHKLAAPDLTDAQRAEMEEVRWGLMGIERLGWMDGWMGAWMDGWMGGWMW